MTYYCELKLSNCPDGGYEVMFPDVRGVYTQGNSKEHALAMAKEALDLMLDGTPEENVHSPLPVDRSNEGLFPIEVDINIAQRILKSKILVLKSEHKNKIEELEKELNILENAIS